MKKKTWSYVHILQVQVPSGQRCIYLVMWPHSWPQDFFFHAEIFKSGYFMQIYSNQSVLCRNIGQVPLRVTQSCAADYLDRTWMQCLFFFQVPLINKNGTKSMHCIIRGKFVISPCRKSALFWIHAVILLFHAEILPCGPPLLPHSCAEPFLGVMQKYSFLGDIYTSEPN